MSNGSNGGIMGARINFLLWSLFLALALPQWAAAVSFTPLNSSPCVTSGGLNIGGFCSDIGIDYSQATGNLVTSVHFETQGNPNNLDNVNRFTGARSANVTL